MSLYNKYRPKALKDILGQEIDIFEQLCRNPGFGNAIIFYGPAGTGKTLLAHMYSKYVNCLSIDNKPCGICEECLSDDNIFETDGAVQTGIDSMRELMASMRYQGLHGKYKIYIVDEAHLLSPNAKEALLIMLHDPPLHVRIIFCTTAIEKIPDTFVSRCIVFRVFRLKDEDIMSILRNICAGESKLVDDKILELIVQYSEGSARKAISHLEPMLLCNNLSLEVARHYLNILDFNVSVSMIKSCLDDKIIQAIEVYNNLQRSGYSDKTVLHSLLDVINRIYLCKANYIKDDDICKDLMKEYKITNEWLANVFDILCKGLSYMYQINGPSVKIPSILMMIGSVVPEKTLSDAVKKAFASEIADTSFGKKI